MKNKTKDIMNSEKIRNKELRSIKNLLMNFNKIYLLMNFNKIY
jgi:hypothetical protein